MDKIKELLQNKDEDVRHKAIEALYQKEANAEGFSLALTALGDESWRVRKAAADLLHSELYRESKPLPEALIECLKDENNAGLRNSAIEVLTKLGSDAVAALIKALSDEDADLRKFIVDILGEIRDNSTVPNLVSLLKDPDENVKAAAGEALGKIGGSEVTTALIDALHEDDLWLSFSVLEALSRVRNEKLPIHKIAELSKNTVLKKAAVEALGASGNYKAIQHILPILKEKGAATRLSAVCAVMRIFEELKDAEKQKLTDDVSSLAELQLITPLLETTSGEERLSVIKIIGITARNSTDFEWLSKILLLAEDEELREVIFNTIIQMRNFALRPLVETFEKSSDRSRAFICHLLGEIGDKEGIPLLTSALKDTYGHARQTALIALGRIGSPETVPSVLELLDDEYDDVESAAVSAAVMIGNKDPGAVLNALEGFSNGKNEKIRKNITMILGGVGVKEALARVEAALKDEDSGVRQAAAVAIGKLGFDEGIAYLNAAIADEQTPVRLAAVRALAGFSTADAKRLLTLAAIDEDLWVRSAALKCLTGFPERSTVEIAAKATLDAAVPVAISAIETLVALANNNSELKTMVRKGIEVALGNKEVVVQSLAKEKLAEL